jgi:hypothetical protein
LGRIPYALPLSLCCFIKSQAAAITTAFFAFLFAALVPGLVISGADCVVGAMMGESECKSEVSKELRRHGAGEEIKSLPKAIDISASI